MDREKYNRQLIRWVKNHYWDSLEKDKDLILRHLRTFAGDVVFDCELEDEPRASAVEYTHFYFKINENDSDGEIMDHGVFLGAGGTTIKVASSFNGWLAFVKHISSMTNEIRENI